jgi:hypothetical protein
MRNIALRLARISVPGAMFRSDSKRHPKEEMFTRVAGLGDMPGMDRRAVSFIR